MSGQTPPCNMVSLAGGAMSYGAGSSQCKAFLKAAKDWCEGPKAPATRRGSFNDAFFKELKKTDRAAYRQLVQGREAAALYQNGNFAGMARDVARTIPATGPLTATQSAAQAVTSTFTRTMSATGGCFNFARYLAGGASWAAQGISLAGLTGSARWAAMSGGIRTRFFDAMHGGTPVEIKGPGDSYSKNQLSDMQKASKPPGQSIEISCQACGVTKGWSSCEAFLANN